MFTKESIQKELSRIQQSVPQMFKDSVITEQKITPTLEMVIDKALEDPDISEEKKNHYRYLKEKGSFNRASPQENKKVSKQIDAYVKREINKSIKAGRLPTKKQYKEIQND